jgi:large subunit ribosomal protein L24
MGADAARLEEISFHYGPAERATALAGSGEFVYGAEPRLNAELTARQIDIDRMLATPDAPRRLPFSAVRAFGELVGGALRPPWPLRLAVRTDVATLGGAPLQAVAADLRSDGKDWHLERLEFRAPGFTQVRLSGKLYPVGAGLGFAGDANVDSGDSRLLMAWIAGQAGTAGPVKPWQAKGTVILGADRIAVERLQTEFGHGPIEGRVGYSWPAGNRAARLDAELKAAELDFDAVLGFGEAALPGLGLERPREAALAIEIGRARVAGFEARNLTARLKIDGAGVAIERVSIADFGNAGVEVRGRIAAEPSAGDNITADLDARELNGVLALTERYLPALAAPLRRLAGAQGSAKLRAVVSRERAAAGLANARVDLTGRIGALRVNLLASAEGTSEALSMTDLPALADAELRLGGQFDADDGGALLAALGLERLAELGRRPGRLVVTANGPLNRALRFDGKLSAGPIDAEGEGAVRLQADRPTSIAIERFIGAVGGHKVSGRLAVQLGETAQLDGAIEAETLDASATIAAAIGLPPRSGDAKGWSPEPFPMVRSDWTGQIAFKARRAAFPGALEAEDLRGVARLTRSGIMFEDVKAAFAKGRFDGRLEVSGETGGLSARARLALSNADAALLFGTGDPPPVAGRLSLRAEVAGSGRSPAAFIGSLSGSGNVALEDARLAGLNPGVFDAVIRAAELGLPLEGRRVAPFVEGMLGSGALAVTRAEAAVGISAGQARLSEVAVQAPAEVMAAASLDLATGTLDALVTLTGQPALSGGARPAVQVALKGAFAAPQRSFDVSSLANWLTMRAVEQQSKQLDVIERQNLERKEEPPKPRTDAPQPVTDRASAEPAPPLPPPVSIPAPPAARPTSSPNAVVRPPGLIGAQN